MSSRRAVTASAIVGSVMSGNGVRRSSATTIRPPMTRTEDTCVGRIASCWLAGSVSQALTFDTERVDVGAMHDTSSNTGRLTVPSGGGGFYAIGGQIEFASNSTGRRGVQIRLNGSTVIAREESANLGANDHTCTVSTVYQLAAGDYVELMGLQASGGNLNMQATSAYSPEFYAHWIAT